MAASNIDIYSQMSVWPEWKESGQGFGFLCFAVAVKLN